MSRRKMPAHLSSLYLTMLMSDIDFSRMSAKASDKGPPYGGGCLLKHHPFSRCGSPIKACRLSGPTTSEFEQADRIRGPQPPQRMPALRQAQPFIDQRGHPLILDRDERANSELPRDGFSLPRVPTQQVGQGERLGHADGPARQEALEG